MKQKAFIEEQPLLFLPSLAVLVGVEAAIILQRIHFFCDERLPGGRMIDGEKWIWNTYEDWQKNHFPFWSYDTIQRAIRFLETKGYLRSCQPDGRASRKKYYRVSTAFMELATIEKAREAMEGKALLPLKRSERSTISR